MMDTSLEKDLDAFFAEQERIYLASVQYQTDRIWLESLGWICDDEEFVEGDKLVWEERPVQIPWKCDMLWLTRMVGEIRGEDQSVIVWMVIERRQGR